MAGFIITGTSGVGKTHLEKELVLKHGFYQLPKTTDRPPRLDEENGRGGIFFVDPKTYDRNDYFYVLDYVGFQYGWKQSDIDNNRDSNLTIAPTLEGMKELVGIMNEFIPILLDIDEGNLGLIEQRMKKRMGFVDLSGKDLDDAISKLDERIDLARAELKNMAEYRELVENNSGKVFSIRDDNTIYDEVIPWILEKCE